MRKLWNVRPIKATGHWQARVTIGKNGDGQRVTTSKVFDTKPEANAWAKQMVARRETGMLPTLTKQTLGDYLDTWLANLSGVREVTRASYQDTIRLHLIPVLGAYPLATLTPEAIRAYIATKERAGLSATTIRYQCLVLRMALKVALADGRITKNPMAGVKLPRRGDPDIQPMDDEQARLFIGAARRWATVAPAGTSKHTAKHLSPAALTYRSLLADLFQFALDTWMRQGEILGLRVGDVDLRRQGRIKIVQTLARRGGFQPPKNKASRRIIDGLRADTVAILQRLCQGKPDGVLVFAGPDGQPLDPRGVLRGFKAVLRVAGLPTTIRFHDTRHTGASIALAGGVPVKEVSARLGHASAKMTLDVYAHLLPGHDQRIVDVLDEAFGKVAA